MAEIQEGMAGNLCRCGCYGQITEAVLAVAEGGRPMSTGLIGDVSRSAVGGIGRVTGAYRVPGRHPAARRAARPGSSRIDCARARIRAIDTSAAWLVPGVSMVMTAADLPQPVPRFGPQFRDRPVLAVGETKYHGEPVAAVAADTPDAAEEAARLVRVDYEELPAVFTLAAALDPGCARWCRTRRLRPGDPLAATNVLPSTAYGWGDVARPPAT